MSRALKIILTISLVANLSIVYVSYKALGYRSHINHFLDKYNNVVNEFSGRDYFRTDNYLLKDKLVGNRIVLFGTQVTSKWNMHDSSGSFTFVNRGLPHQHLAGYLLRFKPDVIDLKPLIVVIEVSSYNFRPQHSLQEIEDYVSSMAELAIFHDITPVLTTVIPPGKMAVSSLNSQDYSDDYSILDSLRSYNSWIKLFVKDNSYGYVDFNGLLSDDNGFLNDQFSDGLIDLNSNGYQLVSKALLESLESYKPAE